MWQRRKEISSESSLWLDDKQARMLDSCSESNLGGRQMNYIGSEKYDILDIKQIYALYIN